MSVPACVEKGSGSTTLLFLHGVGGGHAAWDAQLEWFAARGYRAAAWDAPGYGASAPVDPYGCEQVARALHGLIEQRFGGGPLVLVGHSMGGFIAQEAWALYPQSIKGLVLAFTSPAFGRSEGDFQREFVRQRTAPLDEGRSMAEIAAQLMPAMRGSGSPPDALDLAERIMGGVPPQTYRKAVQMLHLRSPRAAARDQGPDAAARRRRRPDRAGFGHGTHGAENSGRRIRLPARLRPPGTDRAARGIQPCAGGIPPPPHALSPSWTACQASIPAIR